MAEEKKPIRLITYGDNLYSFDALQKAVLDNFNGYASRFGYGRNKFMKDYQGLTELLRLILSDPNVTFEAGRINFSNDYANERGAFGKTRNNSKHYKHPAWMILDTLQGMTPYEEPKAEKKKMSDSVISEAIKSRLKSGWESLEGSNKDRAIAEAIKGVLDQYNWNDPNLYEFDGNNDINYYHNLLTTAYNNAIDNNPDNNEYDIYYQLGLTAPAKEPSKPQLKGYQAEYINGLIENGFTEDEALQLWKDKMYPDFVERYNEEFKKKHGLSTSNNSSSSIDSSSSNNSSSSNDTGNAGVVASPSNPQADSVKSGGNQDQLESETTTSSETTSSNYKTWIEQYRKLKTTEEKKKHFKSFNSNWTDIPKGNGPDGFYRDTKGRVHAPEILSKKSGGYLKLLKNYKDNGRR